MGYLFFEKFVVLIGEYRFLFVNLGLFIFLISIIRVTIAGEVSYP